jgi:hypothetical protein
VSPTGQLKAVQINTANGALDVGGMLTSFDGIIQSSGTFAAVGDGQKFVVLEDPAARIARPLTIVQNWSSLLRKQ